MNTTSANFVPLSPIGFLARAAAIYPDKAAVIHGERTNAQTGSLQRCPVEDSAMAIPLR